MWEPTNGTNLCGVNKKHLRINSNFDYVLWFPKGEKTPLGKFKKIWFGLFKV